MEKLGVGSSMVKSIRWYLKILGLTEEIYNSKSMKKLRNINDINDVCYECPNFEKCKGGAKCVAFSYFNNAQAPDPQCWRLFSDLPDSSLKWKNSTKRRKKKLDSKWYKKKK